MPHGGKREGAGRKKSATSVPVHWRISPEAKEWITSQAKEQGVSIEKVIDRLIGDAMQKWAEEQEQSVMPHPYDDIDLCEAILRGVVKKDIILEDYLMNNPDRVTEILKRFFAGMDTTDSCRFCAEYDSVCPFVNNFTPFPNRPCSAYRRKTDLSLLWDWLE